MTPTSAASLANASLADDALASDPQIRRLLRRGFLLLVVGLGGLLLWSSLAPLSQSVAGHGTVAVAAQRQAVQHAEGGTIQALAVAEGDDVRQGQVLLTLDMTPQRAELENLSRQALAFGAARARLQALLFGAPALQFDAALQEQAAALTDGERALALQQALFVSQRHGHREEGQQLEARRAQLRTEIAGREQQIERQQQQRELVDQQLAQLESLTREGYYPKIKLIDAQRQSVSAAREESQARSELQRSREALLEASSAQGKRAGDARREWETELMDTERQLSSLRSRIDALRHQIERAAVLAPVSGKVMGLTAHTVGGVVKPGELLMELVPADGALIVESRFALTAGEKLAAGMATDLHFSSMDQHRTPVVRGEVLTVSADRLQDARSGESYLLVRVAVPAAERQRLAAGGVQLRPGLPVQVFASLGERSLLALILKPLGDRLNGAFAG